MLIKAIQKTGPIIMGSASLVNQVIYTRPNAPQGPFFIRVGEYVVACNVGDPMWVRLLDNYCPDDEFVRFEGSLTFSNEFVRFDGSLTFSNE